MSYLFKMRKIEIRRSQGPAVYITYFPIKTFCHAELPIQPLALSAAAVVWRHRCSKRHGEAQAAYVDGLNGLRGFCTSVFRGRPLVAYCADALRYYFIRTDRANGGSNGLFALYPAC